VTWRSLWTSVQDPAQHGERALTVHDVHLPPGRRAYAPPIRGAQAPTRHRASRSVSHRRSSRVAGSWTTSDLVDQLGPTNSRNSTWTASTCVPRRGSSGRAPTSARPRRSSHAAGPGRPSGRAASSAVGPVGVEPTIPRTCYQRGVGVHPLDSRVASSIRSPVRGTVSRYPVRTGSGPACPSRPG
jgi:hypothetical protein